MKKFARVLTLILSLILCFSLFACETGTTTDQGGNLVPETPGGSTGDNNKPINLLDYFYETFEDTDDTGYTKAGNLNLLLDDITFNETCSQVFIKTKGAVFVETVTLDIGYNGKLTEARYFIQPDSKYNKVALDLDCAMNAPVTYTYTLNRNIAADTILCFQIDHAGKYDESNPIYMDNLRIKLKLK